MQIKSQSHKFTSLALPPTLAMRIAFRGLCSLSTHNPQTTAQHSKTYIIWNIETDTLNEAGQPGVGKSEDTPLWRERTVTNQSVGV